ncbi:TIGR02677 family protein, partial [Rhodococcus rhodochrous]|uniref:TIGR02677 family protein n=1 Tax=Rhodococcus rhodochrous TaxID=1829 RepID=UPI003FD6110F
SLSRLALPDLLADLNALADANAAGDGELVYRKLSRLDATLSDMAERAARFYLVLGELVRTTEVTPETFLAHKDALLTHMREFSTDLARYAPKLSAALDRVQATGVQKLTAAAARHDERVLLSFEEREADWAQRWWGIEHWFVGVGSEPSESERLRGATINAISAVLGLLRRLTEQRRGGVSRESQLRHLAGWFAAAPSEDAAHALFDAVFDLGRPRHFSVAHPDADIVPVTRSWWEAPPVEIARTLAETGRRPAAGAPGRIQRNDAGVRRLREAQLEKQRRRAEAARSLAAGGVRERKLSEPEAEVLLSLLDAALSARVPVSGRVRSDDASSGTQNGVKLTLRPSGESTVVHTARGRLYLDGLSVEVR